MSEMGRCRDCRWWKRVSKDERVWRRENGDCSHLGFIMPLAVHLPEDWVGLSSNLRIITAPEFGCTEFEAKR